jgi:hypothetical protein
VKITLFSLSISFSIFLLSFIAEAQEVKLKVLSRVKVLDYELASGSRVELQIEGRQEPMVGVFVGRMINHPVQADEFLFLNEKSERVLMIDLKRIRSSVSKSKMQPLISTVDQAGETCAAYAIYHLWYQTSVTKGVGELLETFAQENSKLKFLEESLVKYYMGKTFELNSILNSFGKRFQYKCQKKTFEDSLSAIDHVFSITQQATPVLMEFDIGRDMATSLHPLKDFETNQVFSASLWAPRKRGERRSGGHAIVAAASFIFKGKRKLAVLDSNWNEPRIWDVEDFLAGKAVIPEMTFHHCQ